MDTLKLSAARVAVKLVEEGMTVGLGSGSTLALFIEQLGRRVREEKLRIAGVPTSYQARELARTQRIPIRDMMDVDRLDLAFDGADEVDLAGDLVKGAGAAHVLEKIVASAADRFIVVIDESKLVQRLGERHRFPVDVLTAALSSALRRLRDLRLDPQVRSGAGKIGPVISDQGHIVVDCRIPEGSDPPRLDPQIAMIPGVVGHGLFIGLAGELIVARETPTGPTVDHIIIPRA